MSALPGQSAAPLLSVEELHVYYGGIAALKGVSLAVHSGEMVSVIGPNGAGKSTLLRTIVGLIQPRQGHVMLDGAGISGLAPERLVSQGVSLVPEGRHVFATLTVEENIRLGASARRDGKAAVAADLIRVLEWFPILKERFRQRAGQLSGGEQQMLAIGRALMASPRLLLLDEPSLGLAPLMVRTLYDAICSLRGAGMTVLVVEQNIHLALRAADRAYLLDTGRVVLSGSTAELRAMPDLERAYFGTAS